MKFSTSLISLLFCLGTAASKKHALRALRHHEDELTAIGKIRTECMEYFTDMDIDEDDVLSLDDLKTVVTYLMTDVGADEAEVREFADDLSATDVDNDGQIDKAEFMNACTVQEKDSVDTDTDTKMKNVDRAKKQLIKAAKKKEAAKMKEAALKREEQKEAARMEQAAMQKKAAVLKKKAALKEAAKAAAKEATLKEGEATTTTTQKSTHKYAQADIDECQAYFRKMDIDQDGVLSLEDLETVIDAKVKSGNADEAELREFVDDMGKVDVNNDEQIDAREFMSACLNN